MKIFPVSVKKFYTTVVSGLVNWLARTKAAAKLTAVGRLLVTEKPAVRLASRVALTTPEKPAVRLSSLVSGVVKASQKPVARLAAVGRLLVPAKAALKLAGAASRMLVSGKPASNITQVDIDLSHTSFIVTAANRVGNTTNWTNPANAQDAPDATHATWTNTLAILTLNNAIDGTMVAQSNRPSTLLIKEVWLQFYSSASGLPIVDDLLSGVTLGYFINTAPVAGSDTTCTRHGINYNALAGEEFRIDDGDGSNFTDTTVPPGGTPITWANIALIKPWAKASSVVGIAPSATLAAIRLRVVAEEIWNP